MIAERRNWPREALTLGFLAAPFEIFPSAPTRAISSYAFGEGRRFRLFCVNDVSTWWISSKLQEYTTPLASLRLTLLVTLIVELGLGHFRR